VGAEVIFFQDEKLLHHMIFEREASHLDWRLMNVHINCILFALEREEKFDTHESNIHELTLASLMPY